MDAEERKAELMSQNKMSDGRMFKLDFDPRVIGNKILPDGTRKTGIGEFIRKTSLDEFPQFWNVLNGSMSLVELVRSFRTNCVNMNYITGLESLLNRESLVCGR